MRFVLFVVSLLLSSSALGGMNSFIRQIADGVELRNDHVSILLSPTGELLSCKDIRTGTDYARPGKPKIAKALTKAGKSIEATKLALSGNRLLISFERGNIELEVLPLKDYYTFEVVGGSFSELEKVTFIDLKFKYDYSATDAFVAAGVAVTLHTNPVLFPSGEDKEVIGICTAHTGMKGAKLAVVACRKSQLRDVLKTVYASIPTGSVPLSLAGGAYSQDNLINENDCLLTRGFAPSEVQTFIDDYGRLGIKQFDFQISPRTFVQGDFSFPGTGNAATFRQQITDPLLKAGIVSTLHTFSFYIGYDATDILSNPKWQQQLEFRETYVLGKALSTTTTNVELRGGKSRLTNKSEYWEDSSPYMLIDNEIVRYVVGNDGRITCKRAQCGTFASVHKTGTAVKVIGGHYSHIAPKPGSELFYEIARRTAKAYNEGGFKGIYFDALDGLSGHLKNSGLGDYLWYYGAAFINEVLRHCEGEPIIEYSTLYPSIWSARGRGGAWDTPNRGYKDFIDDHVKSNLTLQNRHYVTTLGWFNFYPTQKSMPGNFSTKYMFSDDVDYLGCMAIAYHQPMVYNGLRIEDISNIPALRRNLDTYILYSKLNRDNYFTERVLKLLRRGEYEYRLAQKNNKWGFYEMVYCRSKIRDVELYCLDSYNPFKRQKPFIRIENMYTSECENIIPLIRFDESIDVKKQKCVQVFSSPKDLSANMAIKIRLKGNGKDSQDVICVRLQSESATSGYADYIVRANFEGWKDVILADLDNGELGNLSFKGMDNDIYRTHRYDVSYSKIQSVNLYFAGNCDGIKVKDVSAVPLAANAMTDPVVKIGNASITFSDSIQSGEYLEYRVGEKHAFAYDSIGNVRKVSVSQKGRFRIPRGIFSVKVSGSPELNDTSAQVVLTVGLQGRFVGN